MGATNFITALGYLGVADSQIVSRISLSAFVFKIQLITIDFKSDIQVKKKKLMTRTFDNNRYRM